MSAVPPFCTQTGRKHALTVVPYNCQHCGVSLMDEPIEILDNSPPTSVMSEPTALTRTNLALRNRSAEDARQAVNHRIQQRNASSNYTIPSAGSMALSSRPSGLSTTQTPITALNSIRTTISLIKEEFHYNSAQDRQDDNRSGVHKTNPCKLSNTHLFYISYNTNSYS